MYIVHFTLRLMLSKLDLYAMNIEFAVTRPYEKRDVFNISTKENAALFHSYRRNATKILLNRRSGTRSSCSGGQISSRVTAGVILRLESTNSQPMRSKFILDEIGLEHVQGLTYVQTPSEQTVAPV